MFNLIHCFRTLGIKNGLKYWQLQKKTKANPELALFWAANCEAKAQTTTDEKEAWMMKDWAAKLRKNHALYIAK